MNHIAASVAQNRKNVIANATIWTATNMRRIVRIMWRNDMSEIKRRKLSKQEREKIYHMCNGHCAYCGCHLNYKDMQVDHVKPLRVGGSDDISNMLPACRSCNHYKATLDLEKFRKYLYWIPARLNRDSIPFQVGARFGIVSYSDEPVKFYFEKEEENETD